MPSDKSQYGKTQEGPRSPISEVSGKPVEYTKVAKGSPAISNYHVSKTSKQG